MQAQPLDTMAQPQQPEVFLWHQRGDPTVQCNQGPGTKCARRREIWSWWLDDILRQREARAELVGRVGEAVHAVSPWPRQAGMDMIWDGGEERIKSQSGQKHILLLLFPFHHLLVTAGLYS